jgi:hypothetical protein
LLQHFSGDIAATSFWRYRRKSDLHTKNDITAILLQHFPGDIAATLFWRYQRKSNLHTKFAYKKRQLPERGCNIARRSIVW